MKPAFIMPPPHHDYYYHFFTENLVNLLRRIDQENLSNSEYTLYYSGKFAELLSYFCDDVRANDTAPLGTPTLPHKATLWWKELFQIKSALTAGVPKHKPQLITLVERTTSRQIENHRAVREVLESFGAETVNVDTASISFEEQVKLFYNSKLVVAAHGSGLTNILFMQPGTAVIEINAFGFIWDQFRQMCAKLKLEHRYFECLPEPDLRVPEELVDFIGYPPPYFHGDVRALTAGKKKGALCRFIRDRSKMKVDLQSFEKTVEEILH